MSKNEFIYEQSTLPLQKKNHIPDPHHQLSFDMSVFDFFQHFFFEYKYTWRDRNTSFSKMRGKYDRARCSDNLNHKKVIIHGYRWAPVSDCIP